MADNNDMKTREKALAGKVIHAALSILRDEGGALPRKRLLGLVEKRIPLDDWEKGQYQNSGRIRWQSVINFYSISAVKAGLLLKKKGIWYITSEGEKSLQKNPEELRQYIHDAYREWHKSHPSSKDSDNEIDVPDPSDESTNEMPFDQIEQIAIDGIKAHILRMNPYEFQDLVAALLRGMGYYTPFIAPKGKDGGVDIIAYSDPFGTKSPRIKVQVKHRESSASVKEVRELIGILHKDGDVGILVSSGGFTNDAKMMATNSPVHVDLIDLDALITLWQEFFKKLSDEDKNILPLVPVYFLASQ